MRTLIVEDDFVSRRLLQRFLQPLGTCDVAVNGVEAIQAFHLALAEGRRYDLVCLDIMMPQMDGQEVLKRLRKLEADRDIVMLQAAKVVMTTALSDSTNVLESFRSQCDGYLAKPIEYKSLLSLLSDLGLLKDKAG